MKIVTMKSLTLGMVLSLLVSAGMVPGAPEPLVAINFF